MSNSNYEQRVEFVTVETAKEAEEQCPWAVKIHPDIDGTWICFESERDYNRYVWGDSLKHQ
jgi:hypothetical protein